jgi:hypothetical protein
MILLKVIKQYGKKLLLIKIIFKIDRKKLINRNHKIIIQGYIFKLKNDKKNEFILMLNNYGEIFYFKKNKYVGMYNLNGSFLLSNEPVEINNEFKFTLLINNRQKDFITSNMDDCRKWIKTIKDVLSIKNIND